MESVEYPQVHPAITTFIQRFKADSYEASAVAAAAAAVN